MAKRKNVLPPYNVLACFTVKYLPFGQAFRLIAQVPQESKMFNFACSVLRTTIFTDMYEMASGRLTVLRAIPWPPNKVFLKLIRQSGCANLIDSHPSLQSSHGCKLNTIAWVVELTYLQVVVKCESLLVGHGKARCTVIVFNIVFNIRLLEFLTYCSK